MISGRRPWLGRSSCAPGRRPAVERFRIGAGAQHRAPLHHRAFVDAAIAADQHVVFHDHRQRAHRFQHAADLAGGRDVAVPADLRAASHQGVRIDHGAVVHVGAGVDIHGRHAGDALADIARRRECSIRRARCARWLCALKRFHGVSGFVEERLALASTDISTMPPMRKPSRMPFFTQAFTRQPVGAERSGSAARMRPSVQRVFEIGRRGGSALRCKRRAFGRRAASISACNAHCSPAGRRIPAPFRCSRGSPRWAAPSAGDKPVPAGPSSAIAAFTGMGFDSMKLMSISGRYLRCTARAAAKSPPGRVARVCVISAGISFETTETMPRPPSAISGMVMASSPESTVKSGGTSLHDAGHLARCCRRPPSRRRCFRFAPGAPAWRVPRSRRCGLARYRR